MTQRELTPEELAEIWDRDAAHKWDVVQDYGRLRAHIEAQAQRFEGEARALRAELKAAYDTVAVWKTDAKALKREAAQ